MATSDIRTDMQVIGTDGGVVGEVDNVHGERIKLKRGPGTGSGGVHHFIPASWVVRVDDHVHIDRDAATARDEWTAEEASEAAAAGYAGAGGAAAYAGTTAQPHAAQEKSKLPWIIGAILVLLVLFLLFRGCTYADQAREGPVTDNAPITDGAGGADASGSMAATGGGVGEDVRTYFAGTDAAPRAFAFRNLNFDSGSAAIKPEYQGELQQLGAVLGENAASRVRVVGYADARGAAPANADLGAERAEAVAAALSAAGVDAGRIETASGGESDPVASNATDSGQAENRRTEVVILSR